LHCSRGEPFGHRERDPVAGPRCGAIEEKPHGGDMAPDRRRVDLLDDRFDFLLEQSRGEDGRLVARAFRTAGGIARFAGAEAAALAVSTC